MHTCIYLAISVTSFNLLTLLDRKKMNSMHNLYNFLLFQLLNLLLDFSLTVKAPTLIFISGCGLAISSAKEGKSGFIYNLVKSK